MQDIPTASGASSILASCLPGGFIQPTPGIKGVYARAPADIYAEVPLQLVWMANQLEAIFGELGISQYLNIFVDQGFDTWETILDITESDLLVCPLEWVLVVIAWVMLTTGALKVMLWV